MSTGTMEKVKRALQARKVLVIGLVSTIDMSDIESLKGVMDYWQRKRGVANLTFVNFAALQQ